MLYTKKPVALLLVLCLLFGSVPVESHALQSSTLDYYAENNILFYDPESNCIQVVRASDSEAGSSGAWSERLEWVVTSYGELSMDLQREWGTPWEVVFAQMIKESSIGTSSEGVDAAVKSKGYYNWLGLTGSGGKYSIGEPYVTKNGRKWAQYDSIENMIRDYAGTYISRNGYYDKAFTHLDPDNYDLEGYLSDYIMVYAPPVENDTTTYIRQMMPYINTIREIGAKQGWPSSEELAKQENIQPGGRHPIGQKAYDDGSASGSGASAGVQCSGKNGVYSRDDLVGFSSREDAISVLRTMYYSENIAPLIPGAAVPDTGNIHDNCVAFTRWFVAKFTPLSSAGINNDGNKIAYDYYNAYHDQYPGLTVTDYPTLYSISSWKSPSKYWTNHTGVIVGLDETHAIIAEAAWNNHSMSFERLPIADLSGPGNYYVSLLPYIEPQGILK